MTVDLRFMPCAEFELAIHGYVDGELEQADAQGLLVHLELCERCSEAVEWIRSEIRIHREARDGEEFLRGFDAAASFQKLNARLLRENLRRLAELLYELGKAYFLAGNDSKLTIFLRKKARSIERTRAEARRLVKETGGVSAMAGHPSRDARRALRRADQLFKTRKDAPAPPRGRKGSRTALDNARRYLEEALILEPDLPKARYYLGLYFHRVDRPEEAMREYRRILEMKDVEPAIRAYALQAMGNAYCYRRNYREAIQCYEQILDENLVDGDARFFHVLVGLAMLYAKAGDFQRCKAVFDELVARYPQKLEDARRTLSQAEVFRALLEEQDQFRTELQERYPVLFAG